MKEELVYMFLCEQLNLAEGKNVWSLSTNDDGVIVFDGEIDGKKVQVPADLMLSIAETKSENESKNEENESKLSI